MSHRINFKSFKTDVEVQAVLEAHLPLNQATIIDVFSFLGEQGVEHSGLVDNSKYGSIITKGYQHIIGGGVKLPRWKLLFEAVWQFKFYFNDGKLAEIEVKKSITSF
jgi:hypothetical protein